MSWPVLGSDRVVVHSNQIATEVALEITPHQMNMIGVVLGIVIFDEKTRALHPIVMRIAALEAL